MSRRSTSRSETLKTRARSGAPGSKHQRDGACDVPAVDFGAAARFDRLAVEKVGEERQPFVGAAGDRPSVDACYPQAGDREGRAGRFRKPFLRRQLDFAIERVRPRQGFLVEHGPRRLGAVDGARGEEDAASRARLPGGTEQRDAALEIEPPEALRRVALAAAIAAGNVIEGGMNEMGDAGKHGRWRALRVERQRQERHRPRKGFGTRRRSSGDGDVVSRARSAVRR